MLHPFAIILLVTALWRQPSCFAAMLFCADTITRRRCGARAMGKHLIGREQSRHPFAVIVLVTTIWRLPSCFALLRFGRHLHIAYFTTSLHEHREVKSQKVKVNNASTPPHLRVVCVLRQLHVLIWYCSACCARDVHVLRACWASEPVQTGSNPRDQKVKVNKKHRRFLER